MTCQATSMRLEKAVVDGRFEEVQLLLDVGVDPNRGTSEFRGYPDLVALALENHRGPSGMALARLLLSHRANPNQPGTYQRGLRTHHASDKGIPYKAYDVEIFSATLLMVAAVEGNVDVTRLLLESGADPKARDTDGRTALDYARKYDHPEIVSLLMRE